MLVILALIAAFTLGTFIGYICRVFLVRKTGYTGIILVTQTEEKKIFSLELSGDPDDLEDQDEVIFKVSKHPSVNGPSQ
jgi:hypothetical protein